MFGALCIEGPKWCGKTWTSLNHAESVVYMGDPTNNFQNRTMSLYESGDSNGQVSLAALFDGKLQPVATGDVNLRHLIDLTVRGGWPGSLHVETPISTELTKSYLDTVVYEDMYKVDGIQRDYQKAILLLRSLARNECTVASNTKLVKDIQEYDNESMDRNTVSNYLDIFHRLFILEDQPAFSPHIRASIRVGKSPKRHYVDSSLAVAALGVNSTMLLQDLNTFGFLFESLCERDLRIYAEANGGKLFHYRDEKDKEIDAVVELSDGRWGAFEIKLGANQIDKAAEQLLAMKKILKEHEPAILCVICGMSHIAYTRKDGVMVVPITSLKD